MSPPAFQVDDALSELVDQFSDPLSFLRELVQNALDAGSQEVEVRVELRRDEDPKTGVAVIHVEDWGEGMTREIIETRLTRLFSSAKDGDMTKIGKFGIGFVSVFAIRPDVVCVDTSREGESWRVLFDANRKFKLFALDNPVDGTKVRIFKAMRSAEFPSFSRRVRDVLRYWCKHTAGEVRCDGELVNGPLCLDDAPCQVENDDGFSHIIVGHQIDGRSFYGFYNSGLTLHEGTDDYFGGIAFKVSSPHLEHTLTRDRVIEDAGFQKVMQRLDELVDGALCDRALTMLHDELVNPAHSVGRSYLLSIVRWHALRPRFEPQRWAQRAVAVSPSGCLLTLEQIRGRHRDRTVFLGAARSPVTDRLEADGYTVVSGWVMGPVGALLQAITAGRVTLAAVDSTYCMPVPLRGDSEGTHWGVLRSACEELLTRFGAKVSGVHPAHFDYPGSSIAKHVAVTQLEPHDLLRCEDARELGTGWFSRERAIMVNADHPTVGRLVVLSQREPELAALVLIKLFFLGDRLDEETDGRLARACVELKWQRSTT